MATFPLTTLIYDSSSTSNIYERSVEFQSAKVTVTGQYIFWGVSLALPLFIYWYVPFFSFRRSYIHIIYIYRRWWNL